MKKIILTIGFVLGLTILTAPKVDASEANGIGTVTLKTNVNVRSQDNFNSSIVKVLKKGTSWKVYKKSNGLYNLGGNQWLTANTKYVIFKGKENKVQIANEKVNIVEYAKKYQGVKYVFGGSSPSGFDCSGFIYYVYKNNGYPIERKAARHYWQDVKKTDNPKAGDLIFFKNTYRSGISHIGIYMGDGKFIHASSNKGVTISNVNDTYYKNHFAGYGSF